LFKNTCSKREVEMIALATTYYYELLLRLVDAFKSKSELEIQSIVDDLKKFDCSLLEKDLFIDEFVGFIKKIRKNSEGEIRGKALIKFLSSMPPEEFYKLFELLPSYSIQKIINLCSREEFFELFRGAVVMMVEERSKKEEG
jgi:hypothetical protein